LQSKIAKSSHQREFCAPLTGFPLELGIGARSKKTRMMELPGLERSSSISSAVRIQYTNVTDGRTDRLTYGRTDPKRQQGPRLRIASRSKNETLAPVTNNKICDVWSPRYTTLLVNELLYANWLIINSTASILKLESGRNDSCQSDIGHFFTKTGLIVTCARGYFHKF